MCTYGTGDRGETVKDTEDFGQELMSRPSLWNGGHGSRAESRTVVDSRGWGWALLLDIVYKGLQIKGYWRLSVATYSTSMVS